MALTDTYILFIFGPLYEYDVQAEIDHSNPPTAPTPINHCIHSIHFSSPTTFASDALTIMHRAKYTILSLILGVPESCLVFKLKSRK